MSHNATGQAPVGNSDWMLALKPCALEGRRSMGLHFEEICGQRCFLLQRQETSNTCLHRLSCKRALVHEMFGRLVRFTGSRLSCCGLCFRAAGRLLGVSELSAVCCGWWSSTGTDPDPSNETGSSSVNNNPLRLQETRQHHCAQFKHHPGSLTAVEGAESQLCLSSKYIKPLKNRIIRLIT